VLRLAAVCLCGALLAGCGAEAKESSRTLREKARNQPALPTATTVVPPKGVSGVVHVKTSLGSFAFRLAPKSAPNATRSFARLIRKGFFDGLTIHRIVPGFVIQGGDPSGDGTGGPGYLTHDRVAPATSYPDGTVAMAKTQRDPAGTAGSQFFIVTRPGGVVFDPPVYAVIGHITTGAKVVQKIGRQLTDPQTEKPLKPVVMIRVTLTKP
jgi:cyclophilin family peptidyl-prolyl cis-trans isomerase